MTLNDFKKELNNKFRFERYFFYFLGLSVLVAGLFLTYLLIRGNKFEISLLIFPFPIIAIGTFALYKLPNRYKIIQVDCSFPLTKKQEIIESVMTEFGFSGFNYNANYSVYCRSAGFFRSPRTIYLFIDKDNFYFCMMTKGIGNNGFIDFGQSEKLRQNIKSEFEIYVDGPQIESIMQQG